MSSEPDEGVFVEVSTATIAAVTTVRIYEETLPHLGEGHPELRNLIPSLENAIHDTIMRPTEVYASNPPHVSAFKFCSSNHLHGDNPLVVAVKIVEGTSALLKTAYFPSTVTGVLLFKESSDG